MTINEMVSLGGWITFAILFYWDGRKILINLTKAVDRMAMIIIKCHERTEDKK